ncbi:MAG: hypothetical protein L6V91_08305 [Bacilli bacterium]|jgi:hypothetical protein|nr:MAG: hypothetical protein L6V91_08305 [Bacilli bacterium]
MNKVLSILLVLFSMIALLLERSSCFEIIVVGLLFIIALSIDKIRFKK